MIATIVVLYEGALDILVFEIVGLLVVMAFLCAARSFIAPRQFIAVSKLQAATALEYKYMQDFYTFAAASDDILGKKHGKAPGNVWDSPARVFVSHSHTDAVYCRKMVQALREAGMDVWYDEHNLGAGKLRREIERELLSREHFIVILSPSAVESRWVEAEIDGALSLLYDGKIRTFLPVIAEKCEIPVLLRGYKFISGDSFSPLPGYRGDCPCIEGP